MKKNNDITDKSKIINEWQWIYANYPKFDIISDVKSPSIYISTIGHKFDHLKRSNFKDKYNEILEKESYSICLIDDSLIIYYYIFDNSDKIVGHNLVYIPSPDVENSHFEEEVAISKYLRADYDRTGYKRIIHTLVHLHIGIYNNNFRIPIAHYLSPYDFLYIVLKYVYHNDQDVVDKLICKKQKECLLSSDEISKLRIIFGE